MKLRLDAVVIQQGRLANRNRAVSKEEMANMVRYGAEEVFRVTTADGESDSPALDIDIDAILARGEERTEEMKSRLSNHIQKGRNSGMDAESLLDFSLTGGMDYQEFEGRRYTASARKRKQQELQRQMELQMVSAASAALGKRERKQVEYNEDAYFREALAVPKSNKVR